MGKLCLRAEVALGCSLGKGQGPLTRLHGDSGFLVTGSFALLDFETHPPWSSAHK